MCWSVAFHKILELIVTSNCCVEQSAVQITVSVTVHLDEWCSETPSDCQSSYAWTSMQSGIYMATVEPCLFLSPSAVTLVYFFGPFGKKQVFCLISGAVLFNSALEAPWTTKLFVNCEVTITACDVITFFHYECPSADLACSLNCSNKFVPIFCLCFVQVWAESMICWNLIFLSGHLSWDTDDNVSQIHSL